MCAGHSQCVFPASNSDLTVLTLTLTQTLLFSCLCAQATPKVSLTADELNALTKRTQDGGTEVVQAKAGKGSATLSMAYAAALFADSCLRGLNGKFRVSHCESFICGIML